MSDLDVASNAAPETAAPAEQVVDSSPAVEPTPVVERVKPSSSAREAIDRAFDAVTNDATKTEKPTQPRQEDGKFAPKQQQATDAPQQAVDKQDQPKPVQQASPAPTRFAPAAKEAWANTPDPVKVEVERAFFEMEKGLQGYQEKFAPLKQFDDMARAAGKELPKVVAEYVNMENTLAQNPVAGVSLICQRLGIDPQQLGEALLNGAAQVPQQQPQRQPQAIEAVTQLEQRLHDMQQKFTAMQIDAFAKEHPRFDELSPLMAEMLQTKFASDLSDAYDKASRLQPPAPTPQQPTIAANTATPAIEQAQTPPKIIAKQITGSPQAGSNPTTRKAAGSVREALDRAFANLG